MTVASEAAVSAAVPCATNQMTADLQTINVELERRRRYIETILANMTAGVVSIDDAGTVTTINEAAERLLGLESRSAVGHPVAEVFSRRALAPARELVAELRAAGTRPFPPSRSLEEEGSRSLVRSFLDACSGSK